MIQPLVFAKFVYERDINCEFEYSNLSNAPLSISAFLSMHHNFSTEHLFTFATFGPVFLRAASVVQFGTEDLVIRVQDLILRSLIFLYSSSTFSFIPMDLSGSSTIGIIKLS